MPLFFVSLLDLMGSDLPSVVLAARPPIPPTLSHKQPVNSGDSSFLQRFLPAAPTPFWGIFLADSKEGNTAIGIISSILFNNRGILRE